MTPEEAVAQYRRETMAAGPVVGPPFPDAAAMAAVEKWRKEKEQEEFLAKNPDFNQARDNPNSASAGERALASLPISAQGKLDQIKSHYGEQNVKVAPCGVVIVRDGPQSDWMTFTGKGHGLNLGDFTSLAGPAIEAVPQIAAGIATSAASPAVAIPVAGAAGAAGNVLRQGVASALTGESLPLGERAMSAGISGAAGAAGEAGGRLLFRGASTLSTEDQAKRLIAKAVKENPAATSEGLALREQTGAPMSAAEITKSPTLGNIEKLHLRTEGPQDVAEKAYQAKQQAMHDQFDKISQDVAQGQSTNPANAGRAMAAVRQLGENDALAARAAHAKENFGNIDLATQGEPVLHADNYRAVLEDEIRKAHNPGAPDKPAEKELQTRLDTLNESHNLLTGQQFSDALHYWGSRMKDPKIGGDASYTTTQRIAKRVFSAYQQDLDSAVENAGKTAGMDSTRAAPRADVAEAVRYARDAYAADSDAVNQWSHDALLKRAGVLNEQGAPDTFIKEFLSGNKSTEQLGAMLTMVKAKDPAASAQFKATILDRLMMPAKEGIVDSPDVMLSKLTNNKTTKPMLDALFADDPATRNKLDALAEILRRRTQAQAFKPGAPTTFMEENRKILDKGDESFIDKLPLTAQEVLKAVKIPLTVLQSFNKTMTSSPAMARLLSTKEGVDLLFGITTAGPKYGREAGKGIVRTLTRIGELAGTSTAPEDASNVQ